MRWPLVLFALLVVLLQLLQAVRGGRSSSWGRAAEATRHVFIPFAAAAVLMIAYGKPTLAAQYAAWALVVLQLVHAGVSLAGRTSLERCIHWASLIVVGYLWVSLLPVFDKIPT